MDVNIKNKRTIEREMKHRKIIEERYAGVFQYVESEMIENEKGQYNHYIVAKCEICGELKKSTCTTFSKSKTLKCICQDEKALHKSAKKYADILYTSISLDAKECGYIVGKELEQYVIECTQYDRPNMVKISRYIEMVMDYIMKKYEDRNVKKCRCCGKWMQEASMYHYNKTICIPCHKEMMRIKRENKKNKDKKRKYKR